MSGSVAVGSAYVAADNQATVYLNGNLLVTVDGWYGSTVSFNINAGYNTWLFNVLNMPQPYAGLANPAGLIFAIYCQAADRSILLMHSDASWAAGSTVYQNVPNVIGQLSGTEQYGLFCD